MFDSSVLLSESLVPTVTDTDFLFSRGRNNVNIMLYYCCFNRIIKVSIMHRSEGSICGLLRTSKIGIFLVTLLNNPHI